MDNNRDEELAERLIVNTNAIESETTITPVKPTTPIKRSPKFFKSFPKKQFTLEDNFEIFKELTTPRSPKHNLTVNFTFIF